MADRNRNGIDDDLEVSYGRRSPGDKTSRSVAGQQNPGGIASAWQDFLQGPVRGVANFAGDLGLFLSGRNPTPGNSAGDQMFGMPVQRQSSPGSRSRPGGGAFGPGGDMELTGGDKALSFLDYLSQAGGIIDKLGIGQGVDYSPARADAQNTRDRNSAYLTAVYNQLRQGMDEDRGDIAENFGGAIDRSQQITQNANQATQGAYDAAQAKAGSDAQALGMGAAAASINRERPGLAEQAADAIADQAAGGARAQTQYNSQQANSLEHNSNVRDASRFAETRSQADLNASLASRLAELATLQSQADAQAAQTRQGGITSLGQYLYENAQSQSQQDYDNMLAALEQNAAMQGNQAGPGYTLEQLMEQQQNSGLNTQDFNTFMKLLSSLNK